MTRILGIAGSMTPPGRLSRAVVEALERAEAEGHETELVELGGLDLSFVNNAPSAEAVEVIDKVAAADAVLLISPVYRASMSGVLKVFLDLLPVEALAAKPTGIVAMGATLHHYLGVDWHLRDVLSWFGALVAPTSVYLTSADFVDGAPSERAAGEIDELIETLASLSTALSGRGAKLGPAPLAARASNPSPTPARV
jgi:FMN reductase